MFLTTQSDFVQDKRIALGDWLIVLGFYDLSVRYRGISSGTCSVNIRERSVFMSGGAGQEVLLRMQTFPPPFENTSYVDRPPPSPFLKGETFHAPPTC